MSSDWEIDYFGVTPTAPAAEPSPVGIIPDNELRPGQMIATVHLDNVINAIVQRQHNRHIQTEREENMRVRAVREPAPPPQVETAPEPSAPVAEEVKDPGEQKNIKVKVHIKLDASNGRVSRVVIHNTHRTPSVNACVAALPPAQRKIAKTWLSYNGAYMDPEAAIWGTHKDISVDIWTKAVADATIQSLTVKDLTESTYESSKIINEGYLALGDGVYRLQCVGMSGLNKALSAVRRRAIAQTKSVKEEIITKAKAQAEELLNSTTKACDEQYAKLHKEEMRVQELTRAAAYIPPGWILGRRSPLDALIPFQMVPNSAQSFVVGFMLKFNMTKFYCIRENASGQKITKTWKPKPHDQVNILIWLPCLPSGEYNITSAYLDRTSGYYMPHISLISACMTPADMPPKLDSIDAYYQIWEGLKRVHSQVELNSLLSASPRHWPPQVRAAMPDTLNAMIGSLSDQASIRNAIDGYNPTLSPDGFTVTTTTVTQERSSTWTTVQP